MDIGFAASFYLRWSLLIKQEFMLYEVIVFFGNDSHGSWYNFMMSGMFF